MPYNNLFDYAVQKAEDERKQNARIAQEQLFQFQQAQAGRDWSANNMTAYDKANLQQQKDTQSRIEQHQNNEDQLAQSNAKQSRALAIAKAQSEGYLIPTDANGKDLGADGTPAPAPTPQPGFDFATAGQAAGGQGSLTPTSAAATNPTGSTGTPSGLGPAALSQSPSNSSPLGALLGGSTTPSTTASGQTGKDSGPSPQAPNGLPTGRKP